MTAVTRVVDGIVVEQPFELLAGFTLAESFPPAVAAQMVEVPAGVTVEQGYLYATGVFTPPPPPTPPVLTLAQQATAALAAGLTITSKSTPALNGMYDVSDAAQGRIVKVQSYISANNKFPGSSATLTWPLFNNTGVVVFPSVAEFQAVATEIGTYVWDLDEIALSGTGTLPPATATIA